jgi:hypothetical protein
MSHIKLQIAIPTAGRVPMGFAYSLAGMIAKIGAQHIPTIPEATIEVTMDIVESSNWITNREQLARRAIEAGRTHLMFLDDDMTFEPQIIDIMLGRRQDIVCTNYLIKTEPARDFVAIGLDGQRVPTREASAGLQPIAYSGFGVSIFSVEVFKRTPQPWFLPDFDTASSSYTTEDNPFYRRAREAGFIVYLDHDASKLVSHIGQRAWNWREALPMADVIPLQKAG